VQEAIIPFIRCRPGWPPLAWATFAVQRAIHCSLCRHGSSGRGSGLARGASVVRSSSPLTELVETGFHPRDVAVVSALASTRFGRLQPLGHDHRVARIDSSVRDDQVDQHPSIISSTEPCGGWLALHTVELWLGDVEHALASRTPEGLLAGP
jgi:hypothetical protein